MSPNDIVQFVIDIHQAELMGLLRVRVGMKTYRVNGYEHSPGKPGIVLNIDDDQTPLLTVAPKCVLQDWVMGLGLRHQGVLLTAVRGPDGLPKTHPVKDLVRSYRCAVLNPFVGDPKKAATFIEWVAPPILFDRMVAVIGDHDELNHHYLMHLVHAAEVVGFKHPDVVLRENWGYFYQKMCRKLHVNSETEGQLDKRLTATEEEFKAAD